MKHQTSLGIIAIFLSGCTTNIHQHVPQSESTGTLTIHCDCESEDTTKSKDIDVRAYIDGKYIGNTWDGTKSVLTEGLHEIRVARDGYAEQKEVIHIIGNNSTQSIAFELEPAVR